MNSTNSKNLRVLILDDEPAVVRALELLLGAIGYQTITFTDSQKALSYLTENFTANTNPCDVILSDLRMPNKDGLVVLQELKSLSSTLPFILMSAHATEADQAKAFALGCNTFLAKPFSPDQFHQAVADCKL